MRLPGNIRRLGLLTVCVNVSLTLIKIAVGFAGHSYALIADGIESGADVFSSLITWAGFQISLKPPDEEHPFGHGKYEALAGAFSGLAIVVAATVIAYNAVAQIRISHDAPAWFTLPVLIFVVVVKEALSRTVLRAAASLGSSALTGDAWHHRSDAITSGAAAIGISIALVGGPGYEAADDWAALAACVVILINAYLILRDALHNILDGSVPSELQQAICRAAASTPGVVDTEKCRIRKSGIDLYVSIHIRVNPSLSVFEGHQLGHRVKERMLASNPRIRDVIIHVEPAAIGNI